MLRDIKPPVYFKTSYLMLFAVLGTAFLAVLFFLARLFLKRRKRESDTPPVIKLPHEIAYEALETLKAKGLPAKGMIKEYYSELSDIVRRYIENRFSIRAPEMTTEEFLFTLRDSGSLTGAQKNLVKEFLTLCDIVKFAKYGPTHAEINGSHGAAERLVDETKVVVTETEEAAAK